MRFQVDANLAAANIPLNLFDTIVSADAFERLKPSPGQPPVVQGGKIGTL